MIPTNKEKLSKLQDEIDEIKVEINGVEKRLTEKIAAVRDRVSRIEGQLSSTSISSFSTPGGDQPFVVIKRNNPIARVMPVDNERISLGSIQ